MSTRSACRGLLLLLSLWLVLGCTQEEVGRQQTAALTAAQLRTIGFEQASDWQRFSGGGSLASSTHHSEGEKSLALSGMGYIAVRNLTPLTKDAQPAPQVVGYDIWVPTQQPNPAWHGDTQLVIDAPSAGVHQQYLGYRSLQELPKGQWVRVEFPLPNAVRQALNAANYTDLRFIIAVNVPAGSQTHYLDRFTLGPVPTSCTPVSDDNVCTADTCDPATGQTTHTPVAPGTACSDGNGCNGAEACDANGTCVTGTPPVLDDGNVCTADACDPELGVTHTPVSAGTSCSDGDACNGMEACDGSGTCAAGTAPVVDDGNPCTADACDSELGVTHTPVTAGTSCSDGDACDGAEACDGAGTCAAGTPLTLDDGNPCTADACDPELGVTHTPVSAGVSCSDGNACNGAEACDGSGTCVPGTPPTVDDGNVCTADACDPVAGVTHTPVSAGTSCSDGNACNGAETCDGAGSCAAGTPLVVDDGNACTTDSCDPVAGVNHVAAADGTSCSDGNACTTVDSCIQGVCVGAEPVVCAGEAGECQLGGTCEPATGLCSGAPAPDGTPCDDGLTCSAGDVCEAGECVGGDSPELEEMPCQVAVCDETTGGIVYAPLDEGSACQLDACTFGTCSASGECVATDSTVVDDGDACTIDYCDPELGPTHAACSQIDPTVATTVLSAYAFLFEGEHPVQTGVLPGTIEARRAALLTGSVTTRAGDPLPSVKVTIHGHPELGETLTHADGKFMMLVNGGGSLQVQLHKAGYLDSGRRVEPRWNQTHEVEAVTLISVDPVVTEIELDAASTDYQVAQASVSSDDDGERQATLLIPPGVQAVMRHADGSLELMEQMHVRLTEFTVGEEGPSAMPATLPTNTAYTYAFEVNADEAVAAGAPEIEFSEPLVFYVENFRDFPAGEVAPLGSYDRERGLWVPHESGIVMDIVSLDGGLAQVDITGDGIADADSALEAKGITLAEREHLAGLYPPGVSLWRVRLPHFTQPYDINWPFHFPDDAQFPNEDERGGGGGGNWDNQEPSDPEGPEDEDCEVEGASTLECMSQVYRETIPIAGSPFSLHYSSARAPGYGLRIGSTLEIPLTNSMPPSSLKRVDVEVSVAGRSFRQSFSPSPGQRSTFDWDGLDSLGRATLGAQTAVVRVAYAYDGVYGRATRFTDESGGHFPPGTSGDRTRGELFLERTWTRQIGTLAPRETGFGGWTLSAHHAYDPNRRRLLLGDGRTIKGATAVTARTVEQIVPSASQASPAHASAPDGSIYRCRVVDNQPTLERVLPSGERLTIPGAYEPGPVWQTQYRCAAATFAVGPDESVYFSDYNLEAIIRQVRSDGSIATVVGNGEFGYPDEGARAVESPLPPIWDLAVDDDGSLYFVSHAVGGVSVRKVDPSGIIRTVAGRGSPKAELAALAPQVVEIHPVSGELVVGSRSSQSGRDTIVAIGADGVPRPVLGCSAGAGTCAREVGVLASQFACTVSDFRFGLDGELFVIEGPGDLWTVSPTQTMLSLLGDRVSGVDYSKNVLVSQWRQRPQSLNFGAAGLTVGVDTKVFSISSPLPGVGNGTLFIASEDGQEVYVFDDSIRHIQTLHGMTLAPLYAFNYDEGGLLSSVVDAHGLETTFARSDRIEIVAPHGQRSELTLDSSGFLQSVKLPGGRTYSMANDNSGFILTFEDPTGGVSQMAWDQNGRIILDEDSEGGAMSLVREDRPGGWVVNRTTSLGQVTGYEMDRGVDGSERVVVTSPQGLQSTTVREAGSSYESTLADGTKVAVVRQSDPRWGITTPVTSVTTTLPSGLSKTVTAKRTTYATENPLAPAFQDDITFVNGRLFKSAYDAANRRYDHTTPLNRRTHRLLDEFGRTIELQGGGSPNLRISYTEDKVTAIVIDPDTTPGNGNERTTTMAYDSAGRLVSVTDPLTQVTVFTDFDAADRPETIVLPDASEVQMTYDVMGNVASVTPPGQAPHGMTYGLHGRIESYTPPVGNPVSYEYDLDRHVDLIDFGLDGFGQPAQVDFLWDGPTGQLLSIDSPSGTIDVGYTLGRMTSLVAPSLAGPITTNLAYDGPLPTSLGWSGPVSGQVNWTYNDRFLIETETIGALASTAVTYAYDDDGLVTQAGALTIVRNATSGRVTSKTVGNIRETYTYSSFGELARQTVERMSGTTVVETLYDVIYVGTAAQGQRDALGRIIRKTERIVADDAPVADARPLTTRVYDYGYNADGRPWLESVAVDGNLVSSYSYDENGNRTSAELAWSQLGYPTDFDVSLDESDTDYNTADQLLTYGTREYTWNAFGQLESMLDTATQEETVYEYDLYGNLLSVALPDGRTIEYDVDGAGRRVGRRVLDAQGVELEYRGWIYRDLLRPIAEVDSEGNVVARYVYGDAAGVLRNDYAGLQARLGIGDGFRSIHGAGRLAPRYVLEYAPDGSLVRTLVPIADEFGSVLLVVNATTGEVVQRREYDEFGRTLLDTAPGLLPFGYGGGLYDVDTKLTRFGARDVDHVTGRWLARDPVRFGSGQMNLFLHANADPTNALDPTGLATYSCRRPLDGGDPLGPERGGPFPFYHSYVCIWQGGEMICGGHISKDNEMFGPGAASSDNWNPARCDKVKEDDLCFESCLAGHILYGDHPDYNLLGFEDGGPFGVDGRNCHGWMDEKVHDCEAKCAALP